MKPLFVLLAALTSLASTPYGFSAEKEAKNATPQESTVNKHQWQLLLFTIPGCSSCITMRDQVIEPMIATGHIHPLQFTEIIQVSDADWFYVRGLGYDQIRNLKVRYKTSLFPTLVVTDMQGNKLAENIVGMTSVEHYRAKLDALIAKLEQAK
jgi:thioredoxin-related protein